MNMLSEQLHVPPAEAMATAERLLEAKFCRRSAGTYEVRQLEGGAQVWAATALANQPASPAADRLSVSGAVVAARRRDGPACARTGRLSLHGDFIMPVETRAAPGFQLPSLPFLGKQPAKAKPKPSAAPKGGAKPELLPEPRPKSRREF